MALRPLLLSAVVGIASLGLFHSPAADAQGYISISVGTPQSHHRPYYGDHRYGAPRYDTPYGGRYVDYRGGYQPVGYDARNAYRMIPGHWVHTRYGRTWIPAQYVRVDLDHGYRGDYRGGYRHKGHGGYRHKGHGGYRVHRPVRRHDPRNGYPPRRGW